MPAPDDEKFEGYLRQFRPVVPDPLPAERLDHAQRQSAVLRTWLAAAAAILILTAVGLYVRANRVATPITPQDTASARLAGPSQPLTMRRANALLATSPSYKAAVDNLAFPTPTPPLAPGKQSVIAVLGKERIKL